MFHPFSILAQGVSQLAQLSSKVVQLGSFDFDVYWNSCTRQVKSSHTFLLSTSKVSYIARVVTVYFLPSLSNLGSQEKKKKKLNHHTRRWSTCVNGSIMSLQILEKAIESTSRRWAWETTTFLTRIFDHSEKYNATYRYRVRIIINSSHRVSSETTRSPCASLAMSYCSSFMKLVVIKIETWICGTKNWEQGQGLSGAIWLRVHFTSEQTNLRNVYTSTYVP